jgi:hypothetical protein
MNSGQIEQLDGKTEQQDYSTQSFQRSLLEKQSEAIRECERLTQHFRGQASQYKRDFIRLKKLSISLTLVVTLLTTLSVGAKSHKVQHLILTKLRQVILTNLGT